MSALLTDLQRIWELLRTSLADPASNPIAALMGLAIIVLILLIATILVFMAITSKEDGGEPEDVSGCRGAASDERDAPSPAARFAGVTLAILAVAAALGGVVYSSTDRSCASCHYTERAFETRAENVHAQVACRACHEAGGVSAYLDAKTRGVSNFVRQARGLSGDGPVPSTVADGACLDCHGDILDTASTTRSIRMRHSDVIAVGYHCVECHNTEGHGRDVASPRYPEMRHCILCHTGDESATSCETCHPDDPGTTTRRSRRVFPKTTVVKEDCRGCHSMQPCIDCHGLELPHSRKFVAGYHARPAYTQLNMCLSCHDLYMFCTGAGCHEFARTGIISADRLRRVGEQHPGFRSWHATQKAKDCAGCHGNPDVCEYCHGDLPEH